MVAPSFHSNGNWSAHPKEKCRFSTSSSEMRVFDIWELFVYFSVACSLSTAGLSLLCVPFFFFILVSLYVSYVVRINDPNGVISH